MSNLFEKISRKTQNIRRFGFVYEWDNLMLRLGKAKNRSLKSIQKIESYYRKLPIEEYPNLLKEWYFNQSGRELNLENPTRFTEKIQWLKLNDSTKIKTILADKYLARDWAAEKIGEEHLIPLLGAWDSFDEMDLDKLPNSFVLKCNHGASMNIVVKDKNTADWKEIKEKLNRWMQTDFGFTMESFELHYRDIPRKIIAEQYMKDGELEDLQDYKFFCFHGTPVYCQVIGSRSTNETIDFFDMDWNHMPFIGLLTKNSHETFSSTEIPRPKTLNQMIDAAKIMSKEFSFVRVDLYEINGKMYFGEMTFTPGSGSGSFRPDSMDFELGSLLNLNI